MCFFFSCVTEVYTEDILFQNSIDFGQVQKGISFCSRTLWRGEGRVKHRKPALLKRLATIWFTFFCFVLNAPWIVSLSTWKGNFDFISYVTVRLKCCIKHCSACNTLHRPDLSFNSNPCQSALHQCHFSCTAQVWHGLYGRPSESGVWDTLPNCVCSGVEERWSLPLPLLMTVSGTEAP